MSDVSHPQKLQNVDTREQKQQIGSPQLPNPQTPWLWTYERVVYSDGTSVRTPVRLDTRLAKDGANAEPTRPNLLDGTDFLQLGRTGSAWKICTHGEEPIAGRANIGIFSSAVDGCVPSTPERRRANLRSFIKTWGNSFPDAPTRFRPMFAGQTWLG